MTRQLVLCCAIAVIVTAQPLNASLYTERLASGASPAIDGNTIAYARNGIRIIQSDGMGSATLSARSDDQKPDISGNIVVWQRNHDPQLHDEIIGYDLVTQNEFHISTAYGIKGFPQIGGNIVVWDDNRNGDGDIWHRDIYAYDIASGTEFPISINAAKSVHPYTDGRIVVWSDNRSGDFDVYGYDLESGQEFVICDANDNQFPAAIDGDIVIWGDRRTGMWEIRGYDLATANPMDFAPLQGSDATNRSPSIDAGLIVFEKLSATTGHDIFAYDVAENHEFPLRITEDNQWNPDISGTVAVWEDRIDGSIWMAEIPEPATLSLLALGGLALIRRRKK